MVKRMDIKDKKVFINGFEIVGFSGVHMKFNQAAYTRVTITMDVEDFHYDRDVDESTTSISFGSEDNSYITTGIIPLDVDKVQFIGPEEPGRISFC